MNSTTDSRRTASRLLAPARTLALALAITAFAAAPQNAHADHRTQAKRIYDRLTGTPPSPAVLDELTQKLDGGSTLEQTALFLVDNTADQRSSNFYSVTLKNFATPWTNRDRTVFAPLNDYTATVIGIVRDDLDFRTLLSDDIVYVGNASPAYSPSNNTHYETLESTNADLRAVLQRRTQSSLNGLPPEATAGVLTSRAAAEAFFYRGTNRAQFRFTLLNHLCRDMENVHDTTRPPDRIRQDVTRSPGGDSSVFLNNCIGCHSGMDPMAQAFAYYDYDEVGTKIAYTPGTVQPKYLINSDNFKPGFVTPDNKWENRWRLPGLNKNQIGWSPNLPGNGEGAKSLGMELANSDAFAECQVEKVYRTVCLHTPTDGTEQATFNGIVTNFKNGGSLKRVFAETAAACAGN